MLPVLCCFLILCGAAGPLAAILIRGSRKAALRRSAEREAARIEMDQLRSELSGLKTTMDQLQQFQAERQAALVPQASINLTKRGQILRMSRRGETPQHISAALSLPQKEVNLTLKIHKMLLSGAA
jgi:hypothetical protein